jgi:transcriptional regulator with PAS, ATPase and Fis domain
MGGMKAKTLVIAGLGRVDYALSAAAVVRHFGPASTDILCTSTARLAVHLAEVAAGRKNDKNALDKIVIMGVGLHHSPIELLKAVRQLKKCGASVTWISRVALPEGMPEETGREIEVVCQVDVPLYKIVAEKYGGDVCKFAKIDDAAAEAKTAGKRGAATEERAYADLINACYHYYRNFQDKEPCYRMIRHLAAGDSDKDWCEEERQIVTKYLRSGHREIGGTSEVINDLRRRIKIAAKANVSRVLITGESGTGKETVALLVHSASPRGNEPMISFNCASVAPQLLEARFLGSKKGAYTDAENQEGLFKKAQGSTLFLDEIGELPLDAQGILLRVLEEGKFYPMGGKEEESVDVHIIAATNRDLAKMVVEKKFREDLYYRLNIVELKVPALRDRIDDIRDIANRRWRDLTGRWLKDDEVAELKQYDYPGNVRELFAILERAAIFEDSFTNVIKEMRATKLNARAAAEEEIPDNLEEVIRNHVKRVYDKYGGNIAKAARALGKSQNTVRKYLGV